MDIDWSKAPISAEFWNPHSELFYREVNGEFQKFSETRERWVVAAGERHEYQCLIEKPDTAWNGEGLPPVGTVCEWLDADSGRWLKSEIPFLSSWVIVVRDVCPHPDGPVDLAFDLNGIHPKFRPIRTPEQIAAEERTKAIDDLVKVTCINRGEAAMIYDAGYRKQVAP